MIDLNTFLKKYNSIFQDFTQREDFLDSITRYRNYSEKLFPTTLKSHQHQIAAVTAHMLDYIAEMNKDIIFDNRKAIVMAWIHDDHEAFMEMGDIQAASKVNQSEREKKIIYADEILGIERAKKQYPREVDIYSYGDLLLDAGNALQSKESQLVKMCDKLCGLSEALHEVACGNESFRLQMYDDQAQRYITSPLKYYPPYLQNIEKHLPLVYSMISDMKIPAFTVFTDDVHSSAQYLFWKEAIIKYAPEWEKQRLFE